MAAAAGIRKSDYLAMLRAVSSGRFWRTRLFIRNARLYGWRSAWWTTRNTIKEVNRNL